jgi:hypothetical protein
MGMQRSRRKRSTDAPACLHYLDQDQDTRCTERLVITRRGSVVHSMLLHQPTESVQACSREAGDEGDPDSSPLHGIVGDDAHWQMCGCGAKFECQSPDQWNVIETSLSRKEIATVNSNPLCRKLLQVAATLFRATRTNGIHIGQNHRGGLHMNMRMPYRINVRLRLLAMRLGALPTVLKILHPMPRSVWSPTTCGTWEALHRDGT